MPMCWPCCRASEVSGEAGQLAERALQIDPDNLKALALAGSAAFEAQGFHRRAETTGPRASKLAEPGSPFAAGLAEQHRAGAAPLAAKEPQAGTPAPRWRRARRPLAPSLLRPRPCGSHRAQVTGVVQLAGALAGKAAPGDTVFVFARAAEGPRMPLAILKMRSATCR
jgi:cytochrome c-type biogenesis protein CcmH